ncbi:MAG: hypothetical protein ABJ275_04545 [Maricaulaceae bacterium]
MSSALNLASIFEKIEGIRVQGNETVYSGLSRNLSEFEVQDVGELVVLMCELIHSTKREIYCADSIGVRQKERALKSLDKASHLIEQLLARPQFNGYKSDITRHTIVETLELIDTILEASGVGPAFDLEDADNILTALHELLEMVEGAMPLSPLRGRIISSLRELIDIFENIEKHGLKNADQLAQALTGSIVIYGGKKDISKQETEILQKLGAFLAEKYQPVRPFVELASLGTNAVLMLGGAK